MANNKTITLTLDFEDWAWDFKFLHGFINNEPRHEAALIYALEKFAILSQTKPGNETKTLIFVTGNLIANYPGVVTRAAELGFSIGCHCYHHIKFRTRDIQDARCDIQKFLSTAERHKIGISPVFRAPMFSIKNSDFEHLSLIFDFFRVESGVIVDQTVCNSTHSPVTKIKCFKFFFNLGGTFISWMPCWAIWIISRGLRSIDNIHIYLHPYELMEEPIFRVSFADLRQHFTICRAILHYVRQFQWNNYNGRKIAKKISLLKNERILSGLESGD